MNKYKLKIENIPEDIEEWLKDIIIENNSKILKDTWRSNINSYVVYDYKPFCSNMFSHDITITSSCEDNLNFIKYLYDKHLKEIDKIKKLFDKTLESI